MTLFYNDTLTLPTTPLSAPMYGGDWLAFVNPTVSGWRGPYINKQPKYPPTLPRDWYSATPWKTYIVSWVLLAAPNDYYFANTSNLYPFRNAFVLEITNIIAETGQVGVIPQTSFLKIDTDMDDGNRLLGSYIPDNSVYVLIFTY